MTSTAVAVPALPSPTHPPSPSDTAPPPPPQPTAAPVEGTTSTQVNVRSEPSTAGSVLGTLPAGTKVEITGRDPAGNWWQIVHPEGGQGRGWVTSQYVTSANDGAVPVIGDGTGPTSGNTAVVQQQINVRSGPGTGFNSLGTLNARDVARLTGRDPSGAWLQIEFPSGPEARGWVNAAFVQANGVETLPIITEAGEVIGTRTPTGIPPTATATVVPAWADNDTQENPVASVVFEPLGTQTLIYSGDVSSPEGDTQDWVQFSPYKDTAYASLECGVDTNLQVSLLENGQPVSFELACNDVQKPVPVKAGATYMIHVEAPQFPGGLQYITYTITIQTSP